MSFSQSAHLLIPVFGDSITHHKDWRTCSGEAAWNDLIQMNFSQMVKFPAGIPGCDFHSPALLNSFLSSSIFYLQWLSLHGEVLIMLLSQFPLTLCQVPKGMLQFIVQLMTILVLIDIVFMIVKRYSMGRYF